jgi:anti-sigma regulatory factor (Ser/Thr protein kinase)
LTQEQRIFGCSHKFVERESELERIIAAAHAASSLSILAAPGIGASELLKQAYDELFLSESIIPFYFDLRRSDLDAATAARRFAYEFIVQAVAYARRDPRLIAISPSLDEIARAAPSDLDWIDGAVETVMSGAGVPTLLGIPARARRRVATFIDRLDRVRLMRNGGSFLPSIRSNRQVSVIASGRRRMMYARLGTEQMRLDPLSIAGSGAVLTEIANGRSVEITDSTRDLIGVQTAGSLTAADALLAEAMENEIALTDFAAVERVYTDSIFGGRIARSVGERILRRSPSEVDQSTVIRMLADTLRADGKRLPIDRWRLDLPDIDDASFGRLIRHLHVEEVISAGDGMVSMSATSRVMRDHIIAQSQILESPEKRAIIVGRAMQHNLAEAPRLMTEFYRSNSAMGVRRLLDDLRAQRVARAAIDGGLFKRQLKGQEDATIITAMRESAETVELPRIIYTADTAAFYAPISELCDRERSAIGLTDSGDAWLVAEIDSKLEADAATAEFWCDRLEMAAISSGFEHYQLWLIAPEGFNDDAIDILSERNAFGSSRKQIELLQSLLKAPPADAPADETTTIYEIIITMGDEGELVAARTLNEIAGKHDISLKSATQIKTALVEALINAAEHSLSPDRKAELRFEVTRAQITINIRNRGLKLTNHMLAQVDGPSERRGWGLKLIRELMDEVSVEPTDDGTRLIMVKRIEKSNPSG